MKTNKRVVPIVAIYVRHTSKCPYHGNDTYKRCGCWKHLVWRSDGKRFRQPTKSRTWAGAEDAKRRLEEQFRAEIFGEPGSQGEALTVNQAAKLYISDKEHQGLEPITIRKNKRTVERLRTYCEARGKILLRQVTTADLIEYRTTWSHFHSSESRSGEQVRIKSFFRWAHQHDYIEKDVADGLSPIKVEREPTLPYDQREFTSILNAIPACGFSSEMEQKLRGLVLLMRWSGLSIIDASGLTRDSIQFADGEYRIVTARRKTGTAINNLLPVNVGRELVAVKSGNPKYLFWAGGVESPRSAAGRFSKLLQRVWLKAGIKDGHAHRLRDTAAVEWLKAGVPLEEVSRLLGHKSIKTTEKYYAPWVQARQRRLDVILRDATAKILENEQAGLQGNQRG